MIKAADAIKNFNEEMQKEYDAAEAAIDAAIRRMRGDVVSVDLSRVSPCQRVLTKLQRAYEDGGWSVTTLSGDQRDPGPSFCLRVAGGGGPGDMTKR